MCRLLVLNDLASVAAGAREVGDHAAGFSVVDQRSWKNFVSSARDDFSGSGRGRRSGLKVECGLDHQPSVKVRVARGTE